MQLVNKISEFNPDLLSVDLEVICEGAKVTVKAGSFRLMGVDYVLAEDEEYDLEPSDLDRTIFGHLVLDEENTVRLFVEERTAASREFDWTSMFKHLFRIFIVPVHADVTDFSDLMLSVFRTIPLPTESLEEDNG